MTLAIARSARSETYRFRNERGQVIGHSSLPRSDAAAYGAAEDLALNFNIPVVYVERREYSDYPHTIFWVNLPQIYVLELQDLVWELE